MMAGLAAITLFCYNTNSFPLRNAFLLSGEVDARLSPQFSDTISETYFSKEKLCQR